MLAAVVAADAPRITLSSVDAGGAAAPGGLVVAVLPVAAVTDELELRRQSGG